MKLGHAPVLSKLCSDKRSDFFFFTKVMMIMFEYELNSDDCLCLKNNPSDWLFSVPMFDSKKPLLEKPVGVLIFST